MRKRTKCNEVAMSNRNRSVRWQKLSRRLFTMVSVGVIDDPLNSGYDILSTAALLANLTASILYTFESQRAAHGPLLLAIESVTVFFFAVDYVLRLATSDWLYPDLPRGRSLVKYATSAAGIIDLLSFLPYYLPVFFPAGAAAFRLFRVARIFRLFRINAYYDSMHVITEVLNRKKQQLLSSVFIILILMVASSLCMYSLEHEAQPEVFSNAFSGIWWSASTLLTVGYGDIYPVTDLGKFFSIVITFLGVGMVAIPTGIISAGFVEQYQRLKRIGNDTRSQAIHFIKVQLKRNDAWVGKAVRELGLPHGTLIVDIQRSADSVIPRGDVVLLSGDRIVIGAETLRDDTPIELKELSLGREHPWVGQRVRDLDISRRTMLVMVKRSGTMIVPKGDLLLREHDLVFLYTRLDPKKGEDDYLPGEEL